MQKSCAQVMIAGCGPVGLTLANCLARSSYIDSIVLLDRKLPSESRALPTLPSQRVFSLNGPTLNLFESLGVWPQIRQWGDMNSIEVVSKESQAFFNLKENHAKIVENDEIVSALMGKIKEADYSSKVQFVEDQIDSYVNSDGVCEVKLKGSTSPISTELLVGSDGNRSRVKELAGIHTYGWQYRQKAIVCTMQIDSSLQNQSGYQIYHDGNVLAILPLWKNYVSLVWSLGLPDFQHLMQLPTETFVRKMNNVIHNANSHLSRKSTFRQIPTILEVVNKRLSFPLSTLQSSHYTKERVALIGDAAHTIHPMAGLGVNSGIMDSILLANNIIKNVRSGHDIGDLLALGDYEAKSKAFNYSNSLAMESVKQAFDQSCWLSSQARSLGLQILEGSEGLKQKLQQAVDDKGLKYEWEIQ